MRMHPPTRAMTMKTSSRLRIGAKPANRARTRANARSPCPRIINGPATAPRRVLSLIVRVSKGPGIRAPDKAITKEEVKITNRVKVIVQTFCNRNGVEYEANNDFIKSVIATVTADREHDKIRILYRNGEEAVYSNNQINV